MFYLHFKQRHSQRSEFQLITNSYIRQYFIESPIDTITLILNLFQLMESAEILGTVEPK